MTSRAKIALFCSFLFLGFVLAPGCLHLFESEHDIAVFIDASEEEEKKGNESVKDIEFRLAEMAFKASLIENDKDKLSFNFCTDICYSLFTEIISPPPEQGIS